MAKFIPVSEPSITEKEVKYVTDAVKSGWVSSIGEYITKFEKRFAEYIGTKYALTVTNGTAALHLALVSLGIKEGDEVIIPDFTFVATANAVTYTGAKPIMVDIDESTLCINPESVKKIIKSFEEPKNVANYFAKIIEKDFKSIGLNFTCVKNFRHETLGAP